MKSSIRVELPMPFELPNGEQAQDAVIRLLSIKERMELGRKYQGNPLEFTFQNLQRRLERLGNLTSPIPKEVVEDMPAPVFDDLNEALMGMDLGFDSLEEFRSSEKYEGFRGN